MAHRDGFSEADMERIDTAFSTAYDYEGTKLTDDETPEEFTERCINRYMEEVVEGVERTKAEDGARLLHKERHQPLKWM